MRGDKCYMSFTNYHGGLGGIINILNTYYKKEIINAVIGNQNMNGQTCDIYILSHHE